MTITKYAAATMVALFSTSGRNSVSVTDRYCILEQSEKIIVVSHLLSSCAASHNWFNPHRFWYVRHTSIRSIDLTYCANQPSVCQWEIAGILPHSAQHSRAGHQSLSRCSFQITDPSFIEVLYTQSFQPFDEPATGCHRRIRDMSLYCAIA